MACFSLNQFLVNGLKNKWQHQVNVKRYRWWKEYKKTPLISRYGYKDDHFHSGLMPRLKDADKYRYLPVYKPKDSWNEKRALFGQNDYIDILGDGHLHPAKIAKGVPGWLKGFQGNEYQTLLRKMKFYAKGTFPLEQPTKWRKTKERLDWLWYHLNYRRKFR